MTNITIKKRWREGGRGYIYTERERERPNSFHILVYAQCYEETLSLSVGSSQAVSSHALHKILSLLSEISKEIWLKKIAHEKKKKQMYICLAMSASIHIILLKQTCK